MGLVGIIRSAVAASGVLAMSFSIAHAGGYPSPQPAVGWSGAYVGLHAGYGSSDLDWNTDAYPFGNAANRPRAFDNSDAIWGGHLGAQVQHGVWVVGAEVSLSGGFDTDVRNGDLFFGSPGGELATRVDNLLLVTGRVGYAWGSMLGYAKAGYAGATVKLTTDDNVPFPDYLSSSREWYNGWTIGAGVEYLLSPNLVFGVEYNYIELRGSNVTNIVGAGFVVGTFRSEADLAIHTVLARLSMKLDFVGGY